MNINWQEFQQKLQEGQIELEHYTLYEYRASQPPCLPNQVHHQIYRLNICFLAAQFLGYWIIKIECLSGFVRSKFKAVSRSFLIEALQGNLTDYTTTLLESIRLKINSALYAVHVRSKLSRKNSKLNKARPNRNIMIFVMINFTLCGLYKTPSLTKIFVRLTRLRTSVLRTPVVMQITCLYIQIRGVR